MVAISRRGDGDDKASDSDSSKNGGDGSEDDDYGSEDDGDGGNNGDDEQQVRTTPNSPLSIPSSTTTHPGYDPSTQPDTPHPFPFPSKPNQTHDEGNPFS